MTDIEKQSVATAIAVPMQSNASAAMGGTTSGVPIYEQEKQGAKCCGCCCDYRRAVIIISIIFIVSGIISILGASTNSQMMQTGNDFDDDQVEDKLDKISRLSAIFYGIGLAASIASLIGAVHYKIALVAVNVIWMMIQYVAVIIISETTLSSIEDTSDLDVSSPIASYIINLIVTGLFIYPHVGFIHEVKNGIMSRETYPREEYSCCCVNRNR